uniref:Uncharacterized protein n=1 Tax=Mesocestoides corti TaxID=53468 RepID=A0A5K3FRT5_MESCO
MNHVWATELIVALLHFPDIRDEEKDRRRRGHRRLLQSSTMLVSLCRVWHLGVYIYTSDA